MANEFEELFQCIYGYKPNKKGQAYEMLVSAVLKLLSKDSTIIHDCKLKGLYSGSYYQLDALIKSFRNGIAFGECKDYTEQDKKVGRSDLQKLGGALPDLNVNSGEFFSATGYTKPATQYAENAFEIVGKKINLNTVRCSTEKDKKGRVQKIVLHRTMIIPNYEKAKFNSVFTEQSWEEFNEYAKELKGREGNSLPLCIETSYDHYYDYKGQIKEYVPNIVNTTNLRYDYQNNEATGSIELKDFFIKIFDKLFEIEKHEYKIPLIKEEHKIEINVEGKAKLLVKTKEHDKLITDVDLKKVKFTDDGEVELI